MDSLKPALQFLPTWVPWAGPLAFLGVALAFAAISLPIWAITVTSSVSEAERQAEHSGRELHWAERARLTWNGRRLFLGLALVEAGVLGIIAPMWAGPFAKFRGVPLQLSVVGGVGLVALEVHRRWVLPAALGWRPGLGRLLAGLMVRWVWLAPVVPLAVVLIEVPAELVSWQTLLCLFLLTTLSLGGLFGFGVYGARLVGLARPGSSELRGVVDELGAKQSVQVRNVFVVRWWQCNAFATLSGLVGVSDRALEVLSPEQLRAILAHEVAHLAEAPEVRRGRVLRAALIPALALTVMLIGRLGLVGLLPLGLLFWVVRRWLQNWVRAQEQRADEGANEEAEGYAVALEALYRANAVPAVLAKPGTHPHLYDRLLAAGHTPDFQRPDPPPSAFGALAVIVVFALLGGAVGGSYLMAAPQEWLDAEGVSAWALSVNAGDPGQELARLGSTRIRGGKPGGDVLYDAAEQLSPRPGVVLSHRIRDLVVVQRCQEALAQQRRAQSLLTEHDLKNKRWRKVRKALEQCQP